MSSLLADLTLDYEQLFNDPIEMGIHYGHSILNYFTPDYFSNISSEQSLPRRFSRFIDKQRNQITKPAPIETFRQVETYSLPVIKREASNTRDQVYYQKRKAVLPSREISFSLDTSRYRVPRREVSRPPQLVGHI